VADCTPSNEYELSLRAEGYRCVAGVDEVGRGSWAGPVVAAAVVLPEINSANERALSGVKDSKQLPPAERTRLAAEIRATGADVGIGWSSHHLIDRLGLTEANRRAMLRAIRGLTRPPDILLLDHFRLHGCPIPQIGVTDGDACVLSIAAASVIAKVTRDRWMERCASRFAGYGFERHKGYGTPDHRAALASLGPSLIHRLSYAPCSDAGE
jgi:ribonuclease HII